MADVAEVPLSAPPLAKVLTQIRFPQPIDFDQTETVDAVRRALIDDYPVLREITRTSLILDPSGSAHEAIGEELPVADDIAGHWRVTLANQFVSLETSKYKSRADLIARSAKLIEAVSAAYRPAVLDRVGVRYVNRIEDSQLLARLEALVEPPFMVGHHVSHGGSKVLHSLCDTLYLDGQVILHGRWGTLPPGAAIDPLLSPPSNPHWTLDIDVYNKNLREFSVDMVVSDLADLAKRAHTFFRAAVKPEFLRAFGGSP